MEEVFIVELWGIYNQGNLGVFTNLDGAINYAKEALESDADNYHNYHVTKHFLDKISGEPSEYYEISKDQDGEIQTECFQQFEYEKVKP